MKLKTPLTLVLLCLAAVSFAPSASAGWFSKARKPNPVVAMGENTFSVTSQGRSGFDHDMERLAAEAREDAEKYCAEHGKTLRIVTSSEEKPLYTLGYATVKLVFKALDAGDPELTAGPAAPVPAAPGAPAVPASAARYTQSAPAPAYVYPSTSGFDLYTELNKLDDLRKRGLLTDKEFEHEKKKLLKRSK